MNFLTERLNGLRWRLRATRGVWRRDAEPSDTFLSADPQPIEPTGEIDVPGAGACVEGPIFFVRGWALFPHRPLATVEVLLNGEPFGRARLAHLRPDVEAHWDVPEAISCGFELALERELVELPQGPIRIEAVARSISGESQTLGPVEVTLGDAQSPNDDEKEALPAPASPTPMPPGISGTHVLVFTHQLTLGGAQLYLLDLVGEMIKAGGPRFTVVSAGDGPVRRSFEDLGVPVHICGYMFDDFGAYTGRLEELETWSRGRDFEVALINTATVFTFPAAELARTLGIPYVWSIHESFHPSVLWSVLSPDLEERAHAAIGGAEALIFETEATRRIYEKEAGPARCLTWPYGLDLGPIDARREGFDVRREREGVEIPPDAQLVVCIGTIEPRKGQNSLAQAFDLIAAAHPRAHLAFVGGRNDPDCEALEELIAARGSGDQMHVIPITPRVQRWYGMADLLVCASDVESMPRTVLEAMAWETPVLATNVFGLPEVIRDGETGWLCEARDLPALADGLERALSAPDEERRRLARRAREMVEERHSLPRYAQQVSDLLQDAAAASRTDSSDD